MTPPAGPPSTSLGTGYAEVVGDPIDQSLSPAIHGFWLEQLGIDADYGRRQVVRGELEAYLTERRADSGWRGCNVTMPLKLEAIAIADEASDRAIGAGAANILVPRDGKLFAGNTDVAAVSTVLKRLVDSGTPPAVVTILGSGGAARAALMALRLLGIASVRIHSRNLAEANSLAVQFRLAEAPVPFDTPVSGDGLINATPLGMAGSPPLEVDIGGLAEKAWVIDLVTSAVPTPLLARAAERGLATADGMTLLVEQAADSFRLFFGAEPPRKLDGELFERLRR